MANKIFTSNFRNSLQKKLELPSRSDLLFFLSGSKIAFFIYTKNANLRSSPSQMFYNISVLKIFANFNGKHLRRSFFLLKMQATCNFIKTGSLVGIFLHYFCHLIHFCGCLLSSFQAVIWSVLIMKIKNVIQRSLLRMYFAQFLWLHARLL